MRFALLLPLLLGGAATAVLPDEPPDEPPAGVGVAQAVFEDPLYFYGDASTPQPLDSLTFSSGPHHSEIGTAPPWFDPGGFLPGTAMLYLRAVSLQRQRVEVVVHTETMRWPSQTLWVDREAVVFRAWPEFLLEVASVEPLDAEANPLRIAPLDDVDRAPTDTSEYRVLTVQGEWLYVESVEFREVGTPRGWLRWRDGDRLLIRYNLLT